MNVIGVATNRDVWVSGFSRESIAKNMRSLIDFYNKNMGKEPISDDTKINWTRALKNDLYKTITHSYDESTFVPVAYRPFTKAALYYHRPFIESPGLWDKIFPTKCVSPCPDTIWTNSEREIAL